MIFVERLLTALALLGVIFVVLRMGALILGAAVIGAQQQAAGVHDYSATFKSEAQAGRQFVEDYEQIIVLASLAVATAGASWLTFGGVLPWCREPAPSLQRSLYGWRLPHVPLESR